MSEEISVKSGISSTLTSKSSPGASYHGFSSNAFRNVQRVQILKDLRPSKITSKSYAEALTGRGPENFGGRLPNEDEVKVRAFEELTRQARTFKDRERDWEIMDRPSPMKVRSTGHFIKHVNAIDNQPANCIFASRCNVLGAPPSNQKIPLRIFTACAIEKLNTSEEEVQLNSDVVRHVEDFTGYAVLHTLPSRSSRDMEVCCTVILYRPRQGHHHAVHQAETPVQDATEMWSANRQHDTFAKHYRRCCDRDYECFLHETVSIPWATKTSTLEYTNVIAQPVGKEGTISVGGGFLFVKTPENRETSDQFERRRAATSRVGYLDIYRMVRKNSAVECGTTGQYKHDPKFPQEILFWTAKHRPDVDDSILVETQTSQSESKKLSVPVAALFGYHSICIATCYSRPTSEDEASAWGAGVVISVLSSNQISVLRMTRHNRVDPPEILSTLPTDLPWNQKTTVQELIDFYIPNSGGGDDTDTCRMANESGQQYVVLFAQEAINLQWKGTLFQMQLSSAALRQNKYSTISFMRRVAHKRHAWIGSFREALEAIPVRFFENPQALAIPEDCDESDFRPMPLVRCVATFSAPKRITKAYYCSRDRILLLGADDGTVCVVGEGCPTWKTLFSPLWRQRTAQSEESPVGTVNTLAVTQIIPTMLKKPKLPSRKKVTPSTRAIPEQPTGESPTSVARGDYGENHAISELIRTTFHIAPEKIFNDVSFVTVFDASAFFERRDEDTARSTPAMDYSQYPGVHERLQVVDMEPTIYHDVYMITTSYSAALLHVAVLKQKVTLQTIITETEEEAPECMYRSPSTLESACQDIDREGQSTPIVLCEEKKYLPETVSVTVSYITRVLSRKYGHFVLSTADFSLPVAELPPKNKLRSLFSFRKEAQPSRSDNIVIPSNAFGPQVRYSLVHLHLPVGLYGDAIPPLGFLSASVTGGIDAHSGFDIAGRITSGSCALLHVAVDARKLERRPIHSKNATQNRSSIVVEPTGLRSGVLAADRKKDVEVSRPGFLNRLFGRRNTPEAKAPPQSIGSIGSHPLRFSPSEDNSESKPFEPIVSIIAESESIDDDPETGRESDRRKIILRKHVRTIRISEVPIIVSMTSEASTSDAFPDLTRFKKDGRMSSSWVMTTEMPPLVEPLLEERFDVFKLECHRENTVASLCDGFSRRVRTGNEVPLSIVALDTRIHGVLCILHMPSLMDHEVYFCSDGQTHRGFDALYR